MVNPLSKYTRFTHWPLALELAAVAVLGWLGWQLGQERLLLPWPGLAVWLTVGLVWLLPGLVLLRMVTPDTAWPWFGWLPLSFGLGLAWLMLPVGTVFYFNLNLDYLVWLAPRLNGLLLVAYGLLRLAGRLRWPGGCPQGGEESQIPPAGGLGGPDHPLLTRWLLVLGLAVQAVMLWVFWDAYGFTPGGDEWSYMRIIQRFFGAEAIALRSEPGELYYLLVALITHLSGAALLDTYRLYLYLLLLIIANLGFLLLGQTLFQNRSVTYLAFVVQGLYMLSDIHTDANGVGLGLLARLPEDKFTAWLLVLPLTQTFFLMFVRSGRIRFLGLFGLLAVVNVVIHPIAITWITLSVGAAGLLFAVFGSRRRMLLFVVPFLAVAGVIFFIGGWTQSLRLDTAFDTSITPEGLLILSARRVFFFSVEENSYMGHPFLLSHPLVILALLATVWLLFRLKRSLPAQFLFSNTVVVLLLIFNPITAPLIGRQVAFWQIYRIVWMLPVALTIGYALYQWAGILSRFLTARRPFLASHPVWLKGGLLTAGLLLTTGLLANHVAASWRSLHLWNGVTVTAAERQLTAYLQDHLPEPARILSPPELGIRLGVQIGQIQPVVPFRASNTELIADVNRFYNSQQFDQTALDLLQEFRIAYLIIERDRPLAGRLRFMPGAFTLRYANPDYALYAWQPAQLSDSERAIIEGYTRLGGGDLAAAGTAYRQALSLEPDQPLAILGLSRVHLAQGRAGQALDLLEAAVERSPGNPWLRLELGQMMANTAGEDAGQIAQAAATMAESLALAPNNDLAVYSTAAAGAGQLPAPARQSAAGQTLQAKIIEFLKSWAAAEPNDYSRQQKLAQLYEQLGQLEAAIEQYKYLSSIAPGHPEPYLQQARLYQLLDRPEQTAAVYQEALNHQAQPRVGHLYWNIAGFYMAQGRLSEALAYSKQAAQLAKALMHNAMLGQVYAQQAAIYEQIQQPDQALAYLQLAVETVPTSSDLQIKLVQFYRRQGNYQAALQRAEQSVEATPEKNRAEIYLELAGIYQTLQQPEEGLNRLLQGIEAASDDPRLYAAAGNLYRELGDLEQAIHYYRIAVETPPPIAWHHLSLGGALLADGQQTAGIDQLEQAAALATGDRAVSFRIGQLLLEYQHPRQAVSYLLAATQGDPEQVYGRWLLARAFEQLGQPDKAPLVWLDTDYGKFYVNWAMAQRYPADSPAGSAYRANLQSTASDTIRLPQDPGFSFYQAQALAGVLAEGLWSREQFLAAVSTLVQTDQGQATTAFFQALREQLPADADVQFLFAELLYQRGDTAGARTAYEQTLSLDPGFVKAKERLELLESGTGNNLDNSELYK